jgi:hypothetical protein
MSVQRGVDSVHTWLLNQGQGVHNVHTLDLRQLQMLAGARMPWKLVRAEAWPLRSRPSGWRAGGLGFEAFYQGVLDAGDGVAGQPLSGCGVKAERSGMGQLEKSPGLAARWQQELALARAIPGRVLRFRAR